MLNWAGLIPIGNYKFNSVLLEVSRSQSLLKLVYLMYCSEDEREGSPLRKIIHLLLGRRIDSSYHYAIF